MIESLSGISFNTVFWTANSVAVFAICVLFAGLLIPQILLISFRKQLFDQSDERKIHKGTVPRLGGIAFKPVILFSIAFAFGVCQLLGYGYMLDEVAAESRPLAFSMCCIIMLYLVGIADDLIGIRYKAKFMVQIACGIMMIAGGLWIGDLHGLLGIHELPSWLGYPMTVFVIVFIINSINLIDGIDGLASGLCGAAVLFYGVIFLLLHEYIYAILSFATLGVLVPFFYYNVFGDARQQKKIFMGDTGSLTVGMMLCVLSLKLFQNHSAAAIGETPNIFILAYSPLFIPCLDVVRVYLHRVRNGKNPFLPDKNHIHHKLLAVGMRQHVAMVTIVSVSIIFSLCNILVSKYIDVTLLMFADVLLWTLLNIWLTYRIKKININ